MRSITLHCLQKTVGRLGLGTVKLGRDQQVKYPKAFRIPDDAEALVLLRLAVDLGINVIDTAPAYGVSEQRLGELLPQVGGDWVLVSKAGEMFVDGQSHFDFRPEAIVASVERSLKLLRREVIDIVLIHSNGDDDRIIEQFAVFDTLQSLKKQGKILAGGMSAKTQSGALQTLANSDLLMYELPLDDPQEASDILDKASRDGKQLLLKKVLGSGHLVSGEDPQDAVRRRFAEVLAHDAVASIIVGTINPQHLLMNAEAVGC